MEITSTLYVLGHLKWFLPFVIAPEIFPVQNWQIILEMLPYLLQANKLRLQ
jgi:hypothetical protein